VLDGAVKNMIKKRARHRKGRVKGLRARYRKGRVKGLRARYRKGRVKG
jgi:hypothetical protein